MIHQVAVKTRYYRAYTTTETSNKNYIATKTNKLYQPYKLTYHLW